MTRSFSTQSTDPLRGRGVTAVLGPTNTGKTHLAIERMLAHDVGVIGLPLRLLAREVYDKVVARVGPAQVALITGEEKIKPPSPRFYVCTVEAMPQNLDADFVAIDEIQLAADAERGHVFTNRLFHARGSSETLLLGAATMRDVIRELLPGANLVSRPRLSHLSYAGDKKITRLPRRSAIVAFSLNDVYAIAELVRRQRGGAAVVLGALSPRTRNAQVALYQNGDVDFLVATDAIGMGLNLDLDHVAFAGIRKFDGQVHRNLMPAEVGQIAGRAGRHMNDGTFGVTGQVPPLEPELIDSLENHSFDQVTLLQWRSRTLDFASIDALKESLRETPNHRRLTRSRMVDDVIALENVTRECDVRHMAKSRSAVGLLWEMCQIPDYRKVSPTSHAEFVASLYRFVMSEEGKIPEDWIANQVASLDRTDGDLDTLSNRLAQIRTWTFVSQHAQWLHDPAHWRDHTKAIEDNLSDALHERLTQRFVDRRTSVLMRRLRDKEEMMAEISSDGQILVENHFVGHLDGFRFTPDASSGGIDGKAARHAAAQVLASEFTARADALAAAPDDAIALSPTGKIVWQGSEIGRLKPGETALKPRLQIFADDHLAPPDRERVVKRLEAWLAAHLDAKLKPLMALSEASDLSGLSRGLAFRLTENLGVLRRESASDEIKTLDQTARGQLRKYGVRFGAFNLYFPALLKPASAELLLLLWALHDGEEHGLDPEGLPERPQQGLTSVAVDSAIPEPYWRAAGFHLAGTRAVRIDMLERLSDLIRVRVSWRPAEGGEDAPSGATGDGGFRVEPELMSMVGCSGDEFASILRSLGFRLERKRLEAGEGAAKPAETPAPEAVTETEKPKVEETPAEAARADETKALSDAASAEPEFDEIWRPGRRKEPHRAARSGPKPQRKERDKKPDKERSKSSQRQPRRNQSQGKGQSQRQAQEHAEQRKANRAREEAAAENSPFAALKDLRKTLAARGRSEQS
ncbi:MAG: helicase-related protein [Hyphomicrobiaceae bacterium]|nr:helicase-related protein [Hyphomicrobiaceae bacterium]MDX2450611.1 helicase-related protein [Hyphomicrobiaceae bacterium]